MQVSRRQFCCTVPALALSLAGTNNPFAFVEDPPEIIPVEKIIPTSAESQKVVTEIPYIGSYDSFSDDTSVRDRTVYFRNNCYMPIEYKIEFIPEVLGSDVNLIPNNKYCRKVSDNALIITLPAREPGKEGKEIRAYSTEGYYSCKARYKLGAQDAKHDNEALYSVPFPRGVNWYIAQGNNTGETHNGDSRFAFDFKTTGNDRRICGMRNGVVVKVKEDSNEGGYDKKYLDKANLILVMHDDGSIANYGHLKQGSVSKFGIKLGDVVKEGQVLGEYGMTGFTGSPHLHAEVYVPKGFSEWERIQISNRFKGRDERPILYSLTSGSSGN